MHKSTIIPFRRYRFASFYIKTIHIFIFLYSWSVVNQPHQARIPGFLPGEGAKGMMTLYGMGMSDFWHTQTQICNFSRCLLPYYAWMALNNHSRDTSVPSFCPWDEGIRAFTAIPSVPGVGACPSASPLDPRLHIALVTKMNFCNNG